MIAMNKYNETKIFYKIYDKVRQEYVDANVGAGTNRTQSEFNSIRQAREFNCHGLFKDKERYEIHEFQAEVSSDCVDVDPINEQDKRELAEIKEAEDKFYALLLEIVKECGLID